MILAPINNNEEERLNAVHNLAILDTPPEERFDILTKEAIKKLNVPISTITIIDEEREWFKSCQGLDQKENPREISFCGHAMFSSVLFVVEDTLKDPRFADNPMVINSPYIRFYAGIRLLDRKNGLPIGVFCIKDIKPRKLSLAETEILIELGKKAEIELNKEFNNSIQI
jgi:GAF domain-containing protein